jgi:hypothetical protein
VTSDGANQAYGVDASFGFFQNVSLVTSYAKTRTNGLAGNDQSYQARFNYNGTTWGASAGHLLVGADFNPEIGFVRRKDFRQSSLSGRFSPRPASISWIRQLIFQSNLGYVEREQVGYVESRDWAGSAQVEFENGDIFGLTYTDTYERLIEETEISGATFPAARYAFRDLEASYFLGPQRRLTGSLSLRRGSFYSGSITSLALGQARIELLPQLSIEPSVQFNWIELPGPQGTDERFNQHLTRARVTYSLSPRTYVSGLVQYNTTSDSFSSNFRLRWEWAPGSELFVVYTEDRNTEALDRWSELSNRALVVKVTRLLRL